MDQSQLNCEMLELTLAVQQGDATAEERARLERLLADDPRAIAIYLRVVDDALTLCDAVAARENRFSSASLQQSTAGSSDRAGKWISLPSIISSKVKSHAWLATMAACLLLLATAALLVESIRTSDPPSAASSATSAQVTNLSNVQWCEGAARFGEWSFVEPGDVLRFDAGQMNLFITNGVELLVEGPADVEFASLDRLVARQGRFAARVGPGAIGFRIDTPHAKVVDRGTSFGVSIDGDSSTDVVVYEGLVDLDTVGDRGQTHRRLETGEALSVNRQGQLSRITSVQSSQFLELPQIRYSSSSSERVISAVSDNLRSLVTAKYYRLIPGGFREDCRAYVDRMHQWNGADQRGLPPFLVGGDYIMTFNDDKIACQLEVAVTCSQPAMLYVLIDDRVTPPEWLKRDFVDTGWDVGSDEGWEDRIIDVAVGPGRSIEQVCSVWRREVRKASTVVLGALSQEQGIPLEAERSMYGFVATPLRRDHSEIEP
jgi:FecR protein